MCITAPVVLFSYITNEYSITPPKISGYASSYVVSCKPAHYLSMITSVDFLFTSFWLISENKQGKKKLSELPASKFPSWSFIYEITAHCQRPFRFSFLATRMNILITREIHWLKNIKKKTFPTWVQVWSSGVLSVSRD